MDALRIYADFQNVDDQGRVRLNCVGTIEDLARQRVTLREGMPVTLYTDDLDADGRLDELQVDGIVSFSESEHCWVATIDWTCLGHASDDSIAAVAKDGLSSNRLTDKTRHTH